MKKYKNLNIVHILAIIFIVIITFSQKSYAAKTTDQLYKDATKGTVTSKNISVNTVINEGDDWIKLGEKGKENTVDNTKFNNSIKAIYRFVYTLGMALSVLIASILGLKIMLASAEEKAEVKENLIPYVVGCVILFGAFLIWSTIMRVVGTI